MPEKLRPDPELGTIAALASRLEEPEGEPEDESGPDARTTPLRA
jgi:hypothetical protein